MALGWRKEYLRYSSYFLNILEIYKTRKDVKMFLEIILTLVTLSLFISLALRPTILTVISLSKQIKEKEETIKKMDQKIQSLQLAQEKYLNEQDNISLLNSAIPNEPKPEILVNQLTGPSIRESANLNSLTLDELTLVGKPNKLQTKEEIKSLGEGINEISFNLGLSGNFPNLLAYISLLENVLRPVKIDSLSLSARETDSGKEILLSITGRNPYIDFENQQIN